jgi:hypothetical protein
MGVRSEAAEKFSVLDPSPEFILTGVEGSGQVLDWASLIPSTFWEREKMRAER